MTISDIDPSKTWIYYQILVVTGTWLFALGVWYNVYLLKTKVIPAIDNKIQVEFK